METLEQLDEVLVTEKSQHIAAAVPESDQVSGYSFSAQARAFEDARWFWMAIMMTMQSCLGAIACFFIQHMGGDFFSLGACAMVTMGSNAMFIGLASGRLCLGALYLSVAVNLGFILAGLL